MLRGQSWETTTETGAAPPRHARCAAGQCERDPRTGSAPPCHRACRGSWEHRRRLEREHQVGPNSTSRCSGQMVGTTGGRLLEGRHRQPKRARRGRRPVQVDTGVLARAHARPGHASRTAYGRLRRGPEDRGTNPAGGTPDHGPHRRHHPLEMATAMEERPRNRRRGNPGPDLEGAWPEPVEGERDGVPGRSRPRGHGGGPHHRWKRIIDTIWREDHRDPERSGPWTLGEGRHDDGTGGRAGARHLRMVRARG